MRTIYALALAFTVVVGVATASAQTPIPSPTPPTTKLGFDHDGLNTDGYRLKVDDTVTLVTATCTGVNQARTCEIPFPALTPGAHTLWVIAFNTAGEASSDPFPVLVFVQPAKATNIRIIVK
jgi:hypothetical protein